jgi:hypothetical protein
MRAARDVELSEGRREWLFALLLAATGVGARLAFVSLFPTRAISDFHALIEFGLRFRDAGLAPSGWHWNQFNPGLPMLLSVLFRLFPDDPDSVARIATAGVTGLLPLLPFLLWRGRLAFAWRLLAGGLLALWPGQICFAGVVAQDNWVLPPAIALACLAVARWIAPSGSPARAGKGHPIAAGLLLAAATAIRQEMLVVLLPFAVAVALPLGVREAWRRNALRFLLAAGLPLLALATQRYAATERFALTTQHGGLGLLGSYVPGASAAGWIEPRSFVASVDPASLEVPGRMASEAGALAWKEARRRPGFHVQRLAAAAMRLLVSSDAENLFWSILGPEVLPASKRGWADRIGGRAISVMTLELAVIQGLFAAALVLAVRRRDTAILLLAGAVLLKLLVHLAIVAMGRMMVPVIALELLSIALAARWLALETAARRVVLAVLVGAWASVLLVLTPALSRRVARLDIDIRRTYRFPLQVNELPGRLVRCTAEGGRLLTLAPARARIQFFDADPAPGQSVRVRCRIPPLTPGESLSLAFEDAYAPGGYPDRVVERVELDGRELLRYDLAAQPGSGWISVPIPGARAPRTLLLELVAVRPDPGWSWGTAAATTFEFRAPEARRGVK